MPAAAIAVPVAAWVGGGAIGALAGAVAVGVVYGAVIGAATSLITGKNVLKGALTGAAIGGISAGVLQGVGAVSFLATSTPTTGAAAGGASATTGSIGAEVGTGVGAANTQGLLHTAPRATSGMVGAKSIAETAAAVTPAVAPGAGGSAATSNLWGGAIQGLGVGASNVGAALIKSDAAEDLAETERRLEIDRVNRNEPGRLPKRNTTVTLPERWSALTEDITQKLTRYKQPLEKNQDVSVGLLENKVA